MSGNEQRAHDIAVAIVSCASGRRINTPRPTATLWIAILPLKDSYFKSFSLLRQVLIIVLLEIIPAIVDLSVVRVLFPRVRKPVKTAVKTVASDIVKPS